MPSASHYLRLKHAAKSKAESIKAKSKSSLRTKKSDLLRKSTTLDDATECADIPLPPNSSLSNLFDSFHPSYLLHLHAETKENLAKSLRKRMELRHDHPGRPVYNGHYVRVSPLPLKNPKLVLVSEDACHMLGLEKEEIVHSTEFLKYFSGDVKAAGALTSQDVDVETWSTPYALSIMGKRYVQDEYGGDGYGDGRAMSVGEVLVPHHPFEGSSSSTTIDPDSGIEVLSGQYYPEQARRYELQLKGSGPTPFCRGGDGRTVLRSSIREFLASEAMHHLNVGTTRALCLIASEGEKKKVFFGLKKKKTEGDLTLRPWYSDKKKAMARMISTQDPRLAGYSEEDKREIVNQYAIRAKAEPQEMIEEKCAITTRVCRSFLRVGHFDLFARRVDTVKEEADGSTVMKDTTEYKELEALMWHACYREFYNEAYAPFYELGDAKSAALILLECSMKKIAVMVADWVRVGFVQGNFNADNCLISGKTMDYGPFGWVEVYHPLASKWTAPSDHFGFMNQSKAGYANFTTLFESIAPIIEVNGGNLDEIRDEMLAKAETVFAEALNKALRSKMGLDVGPSEKMVEEGDALFKEIEPLLRKARADWTLFWRQLTYVALNFSQSSPDSDEMLKILLGSESSSSSNTYPFYDTLTPEHQNTLKSWLKKWHKALITCHKHYLSQPSPRAIAPPCERMQLANPKYVLREWMLVETYSKANGSKYDAGDYSLIHELYELSKDPYGEGTPENHQKYYRRAQDESLRTGGTAFMS